MDPNRFDELTKHIADGVSRRKVFKGIGGSAIGGLLALTGAGRAGATNDHDDHDCDDVGKRCDKNKDCCTGKCKDRRCVCKNDDDCPGPKGKDRQCLVARCRSNGTCEIVPKPSGASCDDGNRCTVNDTCDGNGACIPGPIKNCDDNNPCTEDSCDPDTGKCRHKKIPDCCRKDSECKDDDPCTKNTCQDNVCVHQPIPDCCRTAADCDDGNPCTRDTCKDHTCRHRQIPNCCRTDGDCDDADACTTDLCDPATGECRYEPVICPDDNDKCTVTICDTKLGCVTQPITCENLGPCVLTECHPDQGCLYTNLPADTPCADDTNKCTRDICDGQGVCLHSPITCDDDNPCTTTSCDPASGCTFSPVDDGTPCSTASIPNGTCQDGTCEVSCPGVGSPCSTGLFGICAEGTIQCIDPGKPVCVPTHQPVDETCNGLDDDCDGQIDNGATCPNGLPCQNGACGCTSNEDCDDGDPCTTEYCDFDAGSNGVGLCVTLSACDDGNPCTDDICHVLDNGTFECQWNQIGNCCIADNDCPDGTNPCLRGVCDLSAGDETGVCTTGPACDDGNDCTIDICDPTSGLCSHTPATDGTPCNNGLGICNGGYCDCAEPCPAGETCIGGGQCAPACTAGGHCTGRVACGLSCTCQPTAEETGFCSQPGSCGQPCTSSIQCPTGKACVKTCCGGGLAFFCQFPCLFPS
jgi:hypothetical protein